MQDRRIDKIELEQTTQKFREWLIGFQHRNKFEVKNFLPWICKHLKSGFNIELTSPQDKRILASLILEFELDLKKIDDKFIFAGNKPEILIQVIKNYIIYNNIFVPPTYLGNSILISPDSSIDCEALKYIKVADLYYDKQKADPQTSPQIYYQIQLSKDLTALKYFDEQVDPNLIEEFERVLARINSYFDEIPLSQEPRLLNEIEDYQEKKRRHPATLLEGIQAKTKAYFVCTQKRNSEDPLIKQRLLVLEDLLRVIIRRDAYQFNDILQANLRVLAKPNRICSCWRSEGEVYIAVVIPLIYQYFSSLVRGNINSI